MAIRAKIVLLLLASSPLCTMTAQCDVQVATEPKWPTTVYVPRNASVFINCTAFHDNAHWDWEIDVAGDNYNFLPLAISGEYLNKYGIYELPPVEMPGMSGSILRLLINNTNINNRTVIECFGGNNRNRTTLHLYKSSASVLKAQEMGIEQSLNISLTDLDPNKLQIINLTVVNTINQQWMFQLQHPYHIFIAPENASPCEIYTFKVSYTYVGATYTGDGCSVQSPVLSTMLPSLPQISRMQSSQNYSLEKLTGELILTVYFQSATFCGDYPVTNYTLEITRVGVASSGMQFSSVAMENFIKAKNLSDDAIYIYRLSATNSVGTVLANHSQRIYTTDVQAVRTTATEVTNQIKIICDFIQGSEAEGCMVELKATEGLDNTTVNLTRNYNSTEAVGFYNLPFPLSCYHQVYAFDIEADGSIGIMPLPGEIDNNLTNIHSPESCSQRSTSKPLWVVGVPVTAVIILLATTIAVIIVAIILRANARLKTHSRSGRFSIRFSYYEDPAISTGTSRSMSRYSIPNKHGHRISHENARSHQASSEQMSNAQQRIENDHQSTSNKGSCYNVTTAPESPVVFPHFQSTTEELLDNLCVYKPPSFLELQDKSNECDSAAGRGSPYYRPGTSTTVNSTYWDIEDSDANAISDAPTDQVIQKYPPGYTSPLPQYDGENVSGDLNTDCVHDEIADLPRVISPFNFSQQLHTSYLPNFTSSLPNSSSLPARMKAVPYSTKVNILEQHPQLELASSNPLMDDLPPQHYNSNSLHNVPRAPEENLLNELDCYKIPTGGTLV